MEKYTGLCHHCFHFGDHRKRLKIGCCLMKNMTVSESSGCKNFVLKRSGDESKDLYVLAYIQEHTDLKPMTDYEFMNELKNGKEYEYLQHARKEYFKKNENKE